MKHNLRMLIGLASVGVCHFGCTSVGTAARRICLSCIYGCTLDATGSFRQIGEITARGILYRCCVTRRMWLGEVRQMFLPQEVCPV